MPLDLREKKPALARAVDKLLRKAPYASALAQSREGTTARSGTRSSAVDPIDPVTGAVLSAWSGRTLLEVAVPSLDDSTLDAGVDRLLVGGQHHLARDVGDALDADQDPHRFTAAGRSRGRAPASRRRRPP